MKSTEHHFMGYTLKIGIKDLLYAPSQRQHISYHSLLDTSYEVLVGMRNSLIGLPIGVNLMTHCIMKRCSTTDPCPVSLQLEEYCISITLDTAILKAHFRKGKERKGNVLFNDTLNTFYLWLYGVRHMVKEHSDNEKGNPLLPHRLLFLINSKGSFICTIPQTG